MLDLSDDGATLVGVCLLNEPTAARMWGDLETPDGTPGSVTAHAWQAADGQVASARNAKLLLEYLEQLGRAVKSIGRTVWTRVNFYEELEGSDQMRSLLDQWRAQPVTAIDMIGADLYTDLPAAVSDYASSSPYANGRHPVMVMENDGAYTNGGDLALAAAAAGALYHVWELCDSMPERPSGVLATDFSRRDVTPKEHSAGIAAANAALVRAWPLLAGGFDGEAERRLVSADDADELTIASLTLRVSMATGSALLVAVPNAGIYVVSIGSGTAEVSSSGTRAIAERGSFDPSGSWRVEASQRDLIRFPIGPEVIRVTVDRSSDDQ
jgi:hypothetical protein